MLQRCLFFAVSLACLGGSLSAQDLQTGLDPDGFEKTIRPQDDLFGHVNGRWLLKTNIPGDRSNYGAFTVLIDDAKLYMRSIIEDAAKNPVNEEAKKVGDFYTSFMNEGLVDRRGIEPLRPELVAIDNIHDAGQLVAHFGHLEKLGVQIPIGFYVDQDDKDSTRYLTVLIQSGISLPDRDYYVKDDDRYVAARTALVDYITTVFTLAKLPDAKDAAAEILKLETRLAESQWPRTELRDANKRYNLFEISKLNELTPTLPWGLFFSSLGIDEPTQVNVATPGFFEKLALLIKNTPLKTWKQYLQFKVIDAYAPVLSSDFVNANFELHSKQLAGVPELKPRWKRAIDTEAGTRGFGVLGDAIGKLYVAQHFPPKSKAAMQQLVSNLLKSFETSIDELTWMTDETKAQARTKLLKITTKIGYTEKWRDYSSLKIEPDDLIGNMQRSALVEFRRMVDKLGKPIDRTEWGMTPQTVNAYYNPGMNEIVFPAAILQWPFFDLTSDNAVNYGGIGAVIGHEISHAFDDQGSKYDGDGNLNNWWTEADRAAFEKLTGKLVAQYTAYEALPGKNVNGAFTLGENIGDLSGLAIAYKAYRISLNGQPGPTIDGLTADQRFFFGWSQVWRRKYRNEELARRLVTDPHSPSLFRANGPVSNMDAFHQAFGVKPGDKLFKPKEDRIQIW
jgi:putative endopeptidase